MHWQAYGCMQYITCFGFEWKLNNRFSSRFSLLTMAVIYILNPSAMCLITCDINYYTPYQTVNKEAIKEALQICDGKKVPNVMF